jgi:hypothetical protein
MDNLEKMKLPKYPDYLLEEIQIMRLNPLSNKRKILCKEKNI